jgi:hypothetical protein
VQPIVPKGYEADYHVMNLSEIDQVGCGAQTGWAMIEGDYNGDGIQDVAYLLVSKVPTLRKKRGWNPFEKARMDYSVKVVCLLKKGARIEVAEIETLPMTKPFGVMLGSKKAAGDKGKDLTLMFCEKSKKAYVFRNGKFTEKWLSD